MTSEKRSSWEKLPGSILDLPWHPDAECYHPGMIPSNTPPGTWPLFRFRGIQVFLHWSWILVAVFQINRGSGGYPHIGWDIAQYLVLFGIVLLHEFGHAFATRQVGGTAEQILLWPFGGIAFVQAPPRAGAHLWAIAAGPLVNVALWPVFFLMASHYGDPFHFMVPVTEFGEPLPWPLFLLSVFWINTVLILFNLLPIYPLDGGQIFRALLWFKLGPVKSLSIAAWVGLILGGSGILVSLFYQHFWLAILLGLMVQQSWMAIQRVRQHRVESGGRW